MIIKHATGEVIDTDKLTDINAEILEKSHELTKLCERAHRPLFLTVDAMGNNKHTVFFNFQTTATPTQKSVSDAYNSILKTVDEFVRKTTNGLCYIARRTPDSYNGECEDTTCGD